MIVSITSDFDALLTLDGKNYIMEKNKQRIEIDFEEKQEISFFVYPTKEKLLPYAVQLVKEDDNIKCQSPYVVFYQLDNNLFELALKKFKLGAFNLGKVFSKDIMDFSLYVLEAQTSLFVVKEKDQINTFEIQHKFKELAFDVNQKVPYMVANLQDGKYICIFCPQTQTFYQYDAISIKVGEDSFEIVENLFSHAGHGKKTKIKIEVDKVIVESEELLYLKQSPKITSNIKVVPFAFFESVRLKDFNLAKTYLSENLKQSLSNHALKEYFGDFVEVVPYNFSSEKGAFISVLNQSSCKVFSFNFESGKISDINFLREYKIREKK